jgi:hypothetical protein
LRAIGLASYLPQHAIFNRVAIVNEQDGDLAAMPVALNPAGLRRERFEMLDVPHGSAPGEDKTKP